MQFKHFFFFPRNTGGLMRPDQLNKATSNASHSSNQNTNYLHNKTNRYLNSVTNSNGEHTSANVSTSVNAIAKNNFHKTLRKPPKGVYLNLEELLNLAQNEINEIFEVLNRRLNSLKKEVILFKMFICMYSWSFVLFPLP